ncbi:hypothetical protein [Methylomonas rapida]|uniref:Oxidoreductase n=1 Tax=Methylomonas rapida TaxID=2963939 RepID=A0ABY7GJ42_9GAMM|nr:hypothetical protein [Methylomonas rapida]WAR44429.1 hypothetical protein NM686_019050 [Methylomonas rapida]
MDKASFEGLKALFVSTFPKTCHSCGFVYETAEQFFAETRGMASGRSSLKAATEEDGVVIVEVFRNCRCGSTLMDEFGSRRDHSEKGQRQRQAFDRMHALLRERSIPEAEIRSEIVKFLRGEPSLLTSWLDVDDYQSIG